MTVTVITASLPERRANLLEAMQSVAEQTVKPKEHLVAVDYVRRGGARVYNLLASAVTTTWIATLPDDDYFYPKHLQYLLEASGTADVVYSPPETSGPDPWLGYDRPFSHDELRHNSIVSHVALIRTSLVLDLGGWDERGGYDWHFWVKAADAGARFHRIEERTWHYNLRERMWHESRPWLADVE